MTTEQLINKSIWEDKIEITKNSRGYNWTISIFVKGTDDEALKRIEEIDKKLNEKFGKGVSSLGVGDEE